MDTEFNYVIIVYGNCITQKLWKLMKAEFSEKIC